MAKKHTKLPIQKTRKMMKQKSRKMMSIQKAGPAPKDPFGGKGSPKKPAGMGTGGEPIGTRKMWSGVLMEKKGQGDWRPVPKDEGKGAKTPETQGTKQAKTEEKTTGTPKIEGKGKQTANDVYSDKPVLAKEAINPELPKGMKPLNERLTALQQDPNMSEDVKAVSRLIQVEANKQANEIAPDDIYKQQAIKLREQV